jgi:hypothetical protein
MEIDSQNGQPLEKENLINHGESTVVKVVA